MDIKRDIPSIVKKSVVGKQRYKCANHSNINLKGLENYKCPLWIGDDGSFNELGYEIDHIVEFSISHNNDINNLQALCKICHKEKTRRFLKKLSSDKKINEKSVDDSYNKKDEPVKPPIKDAKEELIKDEIPIINDNKSKDELKKTPIKEDLVKENPIKENPIKEDLIKENQIKENQIKENQIKDQHYNIITMIQCVYCEKQYKKKSNYDRHINNGCKMKKNFDSSSEEN